MNGKEQGSGNREATWRNNSSIGTWKAESDQQEDNVMVANDYLRMFAGFFVILSVALGHFLSPYWFLFTLFVGANLFQSAFTKKCPMITMLRKLGVPDE